MSLHRERTVLGLAVCAAFTAALLAISEHVRSMEAGYGLGASQREEAVLRREAMKAERSLASARSPNAVIARAKAWNLGLDYFVDAPACPPTLLATRAPASETAR